MDSTETDIQALVQRAQAGDSDGVAGLFDIFSERIFRYIRMRVADEVTAEDLTQTVWLEMIQALPRYRMRPNAKFGTWLFQIARFRLIDHYRKGGREVSLEASGLEYSMSEPAKLPEIDPSIVDRVWADLPEREQTVLHLRFREGYHPGEIARVLKTTSLNVRVIQHRALKRLRGLIQSEA